MNKDTIRGDWNQVKGKIKEQWGKLTDDDLTTINGKKEQLLGAIQKKYGYAKERAQEELNTWESKYDSEYQSSDSDKHKSIHPNTNLTKK